MFHSLNTVKETMLLGYSILNLNAWCSPMTYCMIVWDIHAAHMCTEKWRSWFLPLTKAAHSNTQWRGGKLKPSLDNYKDTEALSPIRIHLPCILSSTARYQEGKESSVTTYHCLMSSLKYSSVVTVSDGEVCSSQTKGPYTSWIRDVLWLSSNCEFVNQIKC